MNNLAILSSITMTSREIAELTGKQHSNVMRDIRAMTERLEADSNLNWHCQSETYTDAQGKEREQYRLDKNTTITLVAGYDPIIRMRIVTRWQELEAEAAKPPLNPANLSRLQLIEMAMQAEQERLALESKVAEIQPKAEALDLIATAADGSLNLTNAAKTLQVAPKTFIQWLSSHDWIYRRPGGKNWTAYQDKLKQGVMEHKVTTIHKDDGTEKIVEQALVTAKGLTRLSMVFGPLNGGAA